MSRFGKDLIRIIVNTKCLSDGATGRLGLMVLLLHTGPHVTEFMRSLTHSHGERERVGKSCFYITRI